MFVGAAEHAVDADTLRSTLIRHGEELRAFIRSRLPNSLRSRISVDDVMQEVWITSHRKLSCFRADRPDALERWLTVLTHKQMLKIIQAEMRIKRGGGIQNRPVRVEPALSYADLFAGVVFPGRTPSGEAAIGEASCAVRAALEKLTPARREVMILRYVQGKSYEEIARRTRQTPKAVDALLFHGLRQLHELMGPAGRYLSDVASADPSAESPD